MCSDMNFADTVGKTAGKVALCGIFVPRLSLCDKMKRRALVRHTTSEFETCGFKILMSRLERKLLLQTPSQI